MAKIKDGNRWGNWQFDEENLNLVYEPHDYPIDLETCRNSAEVMDWIAQLSEKTWCTNADLGDLVRALDEVFGLRAFCASGRDHEVDPRTVFEQHQKMSELFGE